MGAPFFPKPDLAFFPPAAPEDNLKEGLLVGPRKPARKPSILDRIAARLYQIDPAYESLLSPEDRTAAQRRGLNQLFANLGRTGNLGESLAGVDFPGIVQAAATTSEAVRQRNQIMARERARTDILGRYPPVEGESVAETGARLLKMLPLFIQNGDMEVAGRLTELLKSMGLGGQTAGEHWGNPFASSDEQGPGMFQMHQVTGEVRRVPKLKPYTDPSLIGQRGEMSDQRRFQREEQLADDYRQEVKPWLVPYGAMQRAFRHRDAAVAGNGAAQLQLLYAFINTLDNSVVREGEAALFARAAPVLEQAKSFLNKWTQNKSAVMPPGVVEQVSAILDDVVGTFEDRFSGYRKHYSNRARRAGVDPDTFIDIPTLFGAGRGAAPAPAAPPVGNPADDPLLRPR